MSPLTGQVFFHLSRDVCSTRRAVIGRPTQNVCRLGHVVSAFCMFGPHLIKGNYLGRTYSMIEDCLCFLKKSLNIYSSQGLTQS